MPVASGARTAGDGQEDDSGRSSRTTARRRTKEGAWLGHNKMTSDWKRKVQDLYAVCQKMRKRRAPRPSLRKSDFGGSDR
uniref:Uncharacterized protein n=1 Tax=Leersia perrieri TaxID=77586 RepID=A0A0D9WQM6_9ORYZ